MDSRYPGTESTTRGLTRRAVVILLAFMLVWLGARWHVTRLPEQSPHVGMRPELAQNTLAVVTFHRPMSKVLSQEVIDAFSLGGEHRTAVILSDGRIFSVANENRAPYINDVSRARYWFLPNMVGTLAVNGVSKKGTFPLFSKGNRLSSPIKSHKSVIESPWSIPAFGAHVSCPEDCDLLPPFLANLRNSNLSFDMLFSYPAVVSLVFDSSTKQDDITSVLTEIVARQSPEERLITLPDGQSYKELVPSTAVTMNDSFLGATPITTVSAGDVLWTILHEENSFIATNDKNSLTERLSTPLLTNKVCNKRVVWFYKFNVNEGSPNFIAVGQSMKSIFLCHE